MFALAASAMATDQGPTCSKIGSILDAATQIADFCPEVRRSHYQCEFGVPGGIARVAALHSGLVYIDYRSGADPNVANLVRRIASALDLHVPGNIEISGYRAQPWVARDDNGRVASLATVRVGCYLESMWRTSITIDTTMVIP